MVEKLQSIEEEEEETKGKLTGKAHSAGRTRTRDDYLQITPRAKHHPTTQQRRSREGDSTERGRGRRLETYREIIMMSPARPKGWDQKK